MNKLTKYMMAAAAMLAAACTLGSCAQDEAMVNPEGDMVMINPSIQGAAITQTRATTPLSALNSGAEVVLYYNTTPATYKWGQTTGWTSTAPHYWDKLTPNYPPDYVFEAYAPYDWSTPNNSGADIVNQSTTTLYLAADLLYGICDTDTRTTQLDLVLEHKRAQLEVEVVTTEADIDLKTTTLLIKGAKVGLENTTPATDKIANVTPYRADDKSSSATATFLSILPPQVIAAGDLELEFTIKVGDLTNTYRWKNTGNALTFTAGANTKIEMTVGKTEVTASTVVVTDWVTGTPTTGAVELVITGTAGTATGDAPAFTTFELWKNNNTAGAVTYTKGADDKWTSATPFYLDDVVDTDRFHARHTPTAGDAVTGKSDILEALNVEVKGGQLALNFTHVNAKLTIALAKGTGFTPALTGAAIKLLTHDAVTLTGTATSHAFIKEPTAAGSPLAKDSKIAEITLGGKTYNATLGADLALEAGKHTTLTVTLTPTAATIAVSVTDWSTNSAAATAAITPTDANLAALPGAGVLVLKYGTETATYDWNTTALTLADGASHIYWEDITAGLAEYAFTLTFTPTAADLVTGVKDNLTGTAKVTTHGAQPNFAMTHANSQLNLTLSKGGTYSAAEWAAIVDADATTVTFTGLITPAKTGDYSYTNNMSCIFAPKAAVATTDKITVTIPAITEGTTPVAANTVEVALKNLTAALAAGTKYDITIVVNKTSVSVGTITVSPWTGLTGNGTINYD